MKKTFYLLAITLVMAACTKEKRVIEAIDFKLAYKFSAQIEDQVANDTTDWKYQISAADYATKGDYKNALRHWDLGIGTKELTFTQSEVDSVHQLYTKMDAVDYIVDQAEMNQVVIINEAHHNSFHRVFTKSLLQQLFDKGYKNFGLEALGNGPFADTLLNTRKYPIMGTGHYTKDPQFGNLLRDALAIGYNLFPYENMDGGSGKPREIAQAKNIQKVMEARPDEKFLIHCGFAHVLEGTYTSWEKAMAGRLAEYTGINPLTINQISYSEKSDPKFNRPLLKAMDITSSSILLDKEQQPMRHEQGEAWADIAVLHPNTSYSNGRPNWLMAHAALDLSDVSMEFPVMVLAFKKGEDIHSAVPVDITEVESTEKSCHLALKKGTYIFVVTNGNESVQFEHVVK